MDNGVKIPEHIIDGLIRYRLATTYRTDTDGSEYAVTSMHPADYGMWVSTISVYNAIKRAIAEAYDKAALKMESEGQPGYAAEIRSMKSL